MHVTQEQANKHAQSRLGNKSPLRCGSFSPAASQSAMPRHASPTAQPPTDNRGILIIMPSMFM